MQDNFYYTGITNNLTRRVKEHTLGSNPFTKNRISIKLVYSESFQTRKEAAKREKEIKGWRREKKENLIRNSLH